jgi:signal peptidase II
VTTTPLSESVQDNAPSSASRLFRLIASGASVAILLASDLYSKEVAQDVLGDGRVIKVIDGFWSWHYAENRDVGFSLLRFLPHDARQPVIFTMVTIGLIAMTVYGIRRLHLLRPLVGSVLVVAGAAGNLIDRATHGFVTDFVLWYYKSFNWPIFNLADCFVVIGMFLIIWHEWKIPAEQDPAKT